jgi:ribosomal protein S18 acetylase RimI-like enzyme
MEIRSIVASDREALAELLRRVETFSADEVACALELIDAARLNPQHPDYRILVATQDQAVVGYVCFGPTPMTLGTFDMYWIVADPRLQGKGVGSSLVAAMEEELRGRHARLIRVETSATDDYGPTRRFYQRICYQEEARIRDFYKPGDDLVILAKRL